MGLPVLDKAGEGVKGRGSNEESCRISEKSVWESSVDDDGPKKTKLAAKHSEKPARRRVRQIPRRLRRALLADFRYPWSPLFMSPSLEFAEAQTHRTALGSNSVSKFAEYMRRQACHGKIHGIFQLRDLLGP